MREKIQSLLDAPEDSGLGGRPRIKRFDARPSEYQVLVTTDENPGSPFRQQVAERGWRVIEHVSVALTPTDNHLLTLLFSP